MRVLGQMRGLLNASRGDPEARVNAELKLLSKRDAAERSVQRVKEQTSHFQPKVLAANRASRSLKRGVEYKFRVTPVASKDGGSFVLLQIEVMNTSLKGEVGYVALWSLTKLEERVPKMLKAQHEGQKRRDLR